MTPAPVSMKCLTARPERGAILPSAVMIVSKWTCPLERAVGDLQHPSPTAMLISVSTNPLPLFGITHFLALYISYPAAKGLPLVGVFACADSFFTSSGGEVERGSGGAESFFGAREGVEEVMSVLGRLVKGDVGKDGGSCDGGGVDIG